MKIFNKEYIKSFETDELDGCLYDYLGIDLENHECEDDDEFDFVVIGAPKGESQPIELNKLRKIVDDLIEKGCTHVEIANHFDHRTFIIDGVKFYPANSADYEQSLEFKKQVLIQRKMSIEQSAKDAIKPLDNDIQELINEQKKLKKKNNDKAK